MKLLDLYSGAGGAGYGYKLAGFEVTGVDINPQPRYKAGKFIQADALDYVAQYGWMYDAIHASPPCQASSWSARRWQNSGHREYINLIPHTRYWLKTLGLPYIIENVIGADLVDPLILNDRMFYKTGKRTQRARKFESNLLLLAPTPMNKQGSVKTGEYVTVAGHGGNGSAKMTYWVDAMGIDWMTKKELTQAIPPAYTHFLGLQLMRACEARTLAAA